jgi:hypothetical protein
MVDEMRYNDIGNEVTLIKRFASSAPAAGRASGSFGIDPALEKETS